jgi:hypothetical protein
MPPLSSASSSAAAQRRTTHAATNPGRFSALDWTLFFTAASVFGASFLFMAICLRAFDAGVVSFGRIALGWLALSAVGAARRPIDRADWPRIAALGVTWLGIPLSLFPLAQQHIDSSLAGMINGSTPSSWPRSPPCCCAAYPAGARWSASVSAPRACSWWPRQRWVRAPPRRWG